MEYFRHRTVRASSFGVFNFMGGFPDEHNDIDLVNGGGFETIYNPKYSYYEAGNLTEKEIELKDEMIFKVEDSFKPAVFTSPTGKPSLGFK